MNKITAIINNLEEAKEINDLVDAYIMPLTGLSINYHHTFSLEEIEKALKLDKEIFVSVNKNIHNDELPKLKEALSKLTKLKISGIIFYDISIVNLKKKMNFKTPLVWAQEHLTTNYGTVNYWNEKGAQYAYLSSELTKREILEIKENSKSKLFVNIFGYLPMFTSRRHLVKNYVETFDIKENDRQAKLSKEGNDYLIEDTKLGTTVYSSYILNATEEDFKNVDYLVFNSNFIETKDFKEVLTDYKNKKPNKYPKNLGFMFEDTIYKVK